MPELHISSVTVRMNDGFEKTFLGFDVEQLAKYSGDPVKLIKLLEWLTVPKGTSMEQNPQSHEFDPNKRGLCKFLTKNGACHLPENSSPHINWNRRVKEVSQAEVERLTKERDDARDVLASSTDLANTWARESSVAEADSMFDLQQLIDRLWARNSELIHGRREAAESRIAALEQERGELAAALEDLRKFGNEWSGPLNGSIHECLVSLAFDRALDRANSLDPAAILASHDAAKDKQIAELAAALEEYAQHFTQCIDQMPDTKTCTCGLDKAGERAIVVLAERDLRMKRLGAAEELERLADPKQYQELHNLQTTIASTGMAFRSIPNLQRGLRARAAELRRGE